MVEYYKNESLWYLDKTYQNHIQKNSIISNNNEIKENENNKLILDNKKVKESNHLQLEQESNALELYGKDLTLAAENSELDPVIGRDQEIQLTIKVLSRRGKNNPVLIGSSGVGKQQLLNY